MILGCFMAATGMALPCRASYGIFTLYHKAENGSIPLINIFPNNPIVMFLECFRNIEKSAVSGSLPRQRFSVVDQSEHFTAKPPLKK